MFKYVLEGEFVVFMCKLIVCLILEMIWFYNSRFILIGFRRVIKIESDLYYYFFSLEVKRV